MRVLPVAIIAALMLVAPVFAQALAAPPAPRQERVTFAKGASSAKVSGRLKGDADVDYVVRAAAGQTLSVKLKKPNPANYFNVLPPGSADVAMHVGQTGEDFTGMLPADGDYTVRVYLVRAAARRNETSDYTLTVAVTGKPLAPLPAAKDALVPGTSYHASASITAVPSPYVDPKPRQCQAFVVRRGADGTATVEIPQDDAHRRRILFVRGKPVASDSAEAMTFTREGDVTIVKFGEGERYEIPDALIFGG